MNDNTKNYFNERLDELKYRYLFEIEHFKFNAFIANHQIFNYLIFIELTLFILHKTIFSRNGKY